MKTVLRMTMTIILSAIFILCLVPSASAESGTWGDLNWILDGSGTLTISGNGRINDFDHSSTEAWRFQKNAIKSVVIESGVTSIGDFAFSECNNLASVTIPDSVTSIHMYALGYCDSLASVTIPPSVTNIDGWSFSYSSVLTSIIVDPANPEYCDINGVLFSKNMKGIVHFPGGRTGTYEIPEGVRGIGFGAFAGCSGLTSVTIPSSVTGIVDHAFSDCRGLTSIIVDPANSVYCDINGVLFTKDMKTILCFPDGRTGTYDIPESVKSIAVRAFNDCSGLTNVTIPESVTSIGSWAFSNCYSLTNISIPPSVTKIGNQAFSGCTGLTSATIPPSVTKIEWYTFDNCYRMTNIVIPLSVTSVEDGAFINCWGLTDVYYAGTQENWDTVSIGNYNEYLTDATIHFAKEILASGTCGAQGDNLTWTLYDDGELVIEGSGDMAQFNQGAPWGNYRQQITGLTIKNGVTSIGNFAFSGFTNLPKAVIPASVVDIGYRAFDYCQKLSSFEVNADNPAYCSVDGYLYSSDMKTLIRCPGAKTGTIIIPNSVKYLEADAFRTCSGQMRVVIPEGVETIEMGTFFQCAGLTEITLPNSLSAIGPGAFQHCNSLTSVAIPAGVTNIEHAAFTLCDNLVNFVVASENPAYCAFDGAIYTSDMKTLVCYPCGRTGSLTIPNGVTRIVENTFQGSHLTNIVIPDGITELNFATFTVSNLKTVTIPASVTKIDVYAFNCRNLTDIFFSGPEDQWNVIEKETEGNEPLFSAAIHYNAQTVTINYDSNGGEGVMDPQILAKGEKQTLNANTFTHANLIFASWNTKPDGSGVTYGNCAEITLEADLTLYAQWAEKITVSYYKNDETSLRLVAPAPSNTAFHLHTLAYIEDIAQRNGKSFLRTGYEFVGWSLTPDMPSSDPDIIPDGAEVSFEDDTSLYAIWREEVWFPITYTISPESNGSGIIQMKNGDQFLTGNSVIKDDNGNVIIKANGSNTWLVKENTKIDLSMTVKTSTNSAAYVSLNNGDYISFTGELSFYLDLVTQQMTYTVVFIKDRISPRSDVLLKLPASLTSVEDEAFAGGTFSEIVVPVQVEEIGPRAFAGCPNLKSVFILGETTEIASDAFEHVEGVTIYCKFNSKAMNFAKENGFNYILFYKNLS